jgi:hypothetical protein
MDDQKIKVKAESGQVLEVGVSSKKPEAIWIILGEGVHNAKCKLTPTRNSLAYAALSRFEQISLRKSTTAISSGPGKCFQVRSKAFDMRAFFCRGYQQNKGNTSLHQNSKG